MSWQTSWEPYGNRCKPGETLEEWVKRYLFERGMFESEAAQIAEKVREHEEIGDIWHKRPEDYPVSCRYLDDRGLGSIEMDRRQSSKGLVSVNVRTCGGYIQ